MVITVIEMPVLAPGITCPYCGHSVDTDFVYSVDGHTYRCQGCAKQLISRIKELRNGKARMCTEEL
jgi:DNA-directed RNA polymerase subunit RPC12/RpoP